MAKNYMGVNLTGRSLMHYRTKGSRNGYSKDPNYRPVGSKAVGKIENGRYVYYTNTPESRGNNWQQRGDLHRAVNEVGQRAATGTTSAYNGFGTTKQSSVAANDAGKRYTGEFGYDQSLNRAAARVAAGKRVTTPQRTQVASAKSKRDKAVAKGAANNWQQQAAAAQNQAQVAQRIKSGTSKSGNMSVDGFDFNVSNRGKTITDYSTARAHQNAVNQANAEARARNAIANRGSSGTRKITKQLKSHGSPYVSKEYQEELAYNSKKNVYPKQPSGSTVSKSSSGGSTPSGMGNDPRYTVAGTKKIENAAKMAKQKEKEKHSVFKNGSLSGTLYTTYDPKTGKTVAETEGEREERLRLEAGAKAREKRQKKREREAKVNKMKNAILSVFKKKK